MKDCKSKRERDFLIEKVKGFSRVYRMFYKLRYTAVPY